MCDADMKVVDVIAKWPGSVHDARMLRESSIFERMESPQSPKAYILGDSGYMLRPWLMTPFRAPSNRREERYNNSHTSTRATVERTIGTVVCLTIFKITVT